MKQNVRGAYMTFAHDRAQDWDWLAKWQPNVIRLMMHGSHTDPASVDVNRIRRVHETCPAALILLRVWDVDDRNFEAHEAMVANPQAEADKQLSWWARLVDRAVGVPRNQLMAGLNNETGPEKDAALYVYTERALARGKSFGVRCGGFVFSVGRPSLAGESQYDMPYFERLLPLFLAGDHAMLLHEYMQPEGMYAVWTDDQGNERKDYTYLIGRHKRWNMPGVKKIIAEWGIDGILWNRHPHPLYGNNGWHSFPEWPPDRYADEYVECIRQSDDSVIGECPFLSDNGDKTGKWQSFDVLEAYAQLIARKDLCVKDVASTTPPHETRLPQVGEGPTPPAKPAYVSATAGANIRSSPSIAADKVQAAPYGASVTVIGGDYGDDGDLWVHVRYEGITGWVRADLLSSTPPVTQPPPTPEPVDVGDNWQRTIAFILEEEGGYTANDEGAPANFGINQAANPDLDVKNITRQQAIERYRTGYWIASGADKLEWPFCLLVMDAAVQHGDGEARMLLKASKGNMWHFQGARQLYYANIANDKWQRNGKAWMARTGRLLIEAAK